MIKSWTAPWGSTWTSSTTWGPARATSQSTTPRSTPKMERAGTAAEGACMQPTSNRVALDSVDAAAVEETVVPVKEMAATR